MGETEYAGLGHHTEKQEMECGTIDDDDDDGDDSGKLGESECKEKGMKGRNIRGQTGNQAARQQVCLSKILFVSCVLRIFLGYSTLR